MIYCLRCGDGHGDGHGMDAEQWISTPEIIFLSQAEQRLRKQYGVEFFEGFAVEAEEAWVSDDVWDALYEADFPVEKIFELCDIEEELPWAAHRDLMVFKNVGNNVNLSIECIVEMYIWLVNYHGACIKTIPAPFTILTRHIGYGCFEF